MPATIITSPAIHPELFAILDGGRIDHTETGKYYLVAADWCEERGMQKEADGLRGLQKAGRRPLWHVRQWLWVREDQTGQYRWCDYPHHARVAIYDALSAAAAYSRHRYYTDRLDFRTFPEAVLALAHVWKE